MKLKNKNIHKQPKKNMAKFYRNMTIFCFIFIFITAVLFFPVALIMIIATIVNYRRYKNEKRKIKKS